jgi:hypothetical protein
MDDMLILANNQSNMDELNAQLNVEFKIKNMDKAKKM